MGRASLFPFRHNIMACVISRCVISVLTLRSSLNMRPPKCYFSARKWWQSVLLSIKMLNRSNFCVKRKKIPRTVCIIRLESFFFGGGYAYMLRWMVIGASITACILSYKNRMNYLYLKNGLVSCCSLSWVPPVTLASTQKTVVCAFGGIYDFLSRTPFYSKFKVLTAMVLNVSNFGMFWRVNTSKHPRRLDWINILFIKSLDYLGSITFDVININFIPRQLPHIFASRIILSSSVSETGFRETEMRNGERVLLTVLNLYVGVKIHVATFDCNHSFTDITQSVSRFLGPEVFWFFSQVIQQSSP